jgi:hypothetical protein
MIKCEKVSSGRRIIEEGVVLLGERATYRVVLRVELRHYY